MFKTPVPFHTCLVAALLANAAFAQTVVNLGSQNPAVIAASSAATKLSLMKADIPACGWIRSDEPDNRKGGETMFIGTTGIGSSDLRAYLAFDLSSFSTNDTVSSAIISLYSEGADSLDANGPSTTDANSIALNVTALAEVTGYGPGNSVGVGPPAATIDVGGAAATFTNLNGLYGSVISTVTLNLDTIAVNAKVDFDVTAAVQTAVSAGATKITFGFTSADAIATGARNFFAFEGIDQTTGGGGAGTIGPNLRVETANAPSALKITSAAFNGSGDFVIDFTGPANTTVQVQKSLDLSGFPTVITAQNAPVTTDGSGVGQAIIDAADAAEPSAFFRLAAP